MPANFPRRERLVSGRGLCRCGRRHRRSPGAGRAPGLPSQVDSTGPAAKTWARQALADRLKVLPQEQRRCAALVPEWLASRSGDLATVLWLTRATYGASLDVSGLLLAIWDALLDTDRARDALAYARFMLDLRFGWTELYRDPKTRTRFWIIASPTRSSGMCCTSWATASGKCAFSKG